MGPEVVANFCCVVSVFVGVSFRLFQWHSGRQKEQDWRLRQVVGVSKIGSWPWRKILRWRNEGHQQKATKTVAVIKTMCTQPRWKTCFCQSSAPTAGRQTPSTNNDLTRILLVIRATTSYLELMNWDVPQVNPGIEHIRHVQPFSQQKTIEMVAVSYGSKWLTTQILTVAKRREWGKDPIHTYCNHSIHPFPAFSTSKNLMVYFERPSNWLCLKLG